MNGHRFHRGGELALGLLIFVSLFWIEEHAKSGRAEPIVSQPVATTAPTTQSSARQCFRVAQAKDLQIALVTRPNPKDHYPLPTVKIYNVASDEVIVAYQPGSVIVHCGDFEQPGPAITFVERREILRSQQPIVFDVGSEGWIRSPAKSNGDLFIPINLPSGRYPIWATFRLGGEGGPVIESGHDWYTVP